MHQSFCVSNIWGGEAAHLAALMRQSSHVRIVPPERLRRLMTGRLLVEQYGASLNLVVAAILHFCPFQQLGRMAFYIEMKELRHLRNSSKVLFSRFWLVRC